MRHALLFCILLALPGPLGAQENQSTPTAQRAGSAAAVLLKAGQVAGADRFFLGGWAGLVFRDHLVLGGGGMALTQDVELQGSGSGTGFFLGAGYGGLLFKYWEDISPYLTGEAGLLLGAGHAEVHDRVAGREVGSENFVVMEPEVSVFYNLFRQVYLGASGGYRFAWGIEDLPRVSSGDLQSFTATLSLRVGGS